MPPTATATANDNIDTLAGELKEVNGQIDEILSNAEADGDRRLTEEEGKRHDELAAKADELQKEIEAINQHRTRRQRQADRQRFLDQPRARLTTPAQPDDSDLSLPHEWSDKERGEIRRRYQATGKLRAFRGPEGPEDAYRSGKWLLGRIFGQEDALRWCRDYGIETLAMSGADNIKGGYLVPPEFERAVISLREEYGVARQICRVVPMASDTKDVPVRTSGLTAYAVGDNQEVTASDKAWGNVELIARKWAALAKWSSEVDEDAVINMADDLTDEIAYAFASAEDGCLFLGDGTSTYHGIVGVKNAVAAGSVYTAIAGNLAFGSLDLEDFENMIGQLPEYPGINPIWTISKVGWARSMLRLAAAGGGNTMEMLENGTRRRVFLGYPVVITQKMNSTTTDQASTAGLVHFGDFRMAVLLGDRRGLRVKISNDRYLEYDQLGILGTERMDIVVHSTGTASAAGAIISLTTPGS